MATEKQYNVEVDLRSTGEETYVCHATSEDEAVEHAEDFYGSDLKEIISVNEY